MLLKDRIVLRPYLFKYTIDTCHNTKCLFEMWADGQNRQCWQCLGVPYSSGGGVCRVHRGQPESPITQNADFTSGE